jgi:sortase A
MRAYGALTQAAARTHFVPPPARPVRSNSANPLVRKPPVRAWETSVLQIPKIGVDSVVDEGNEGWTLMPGPGHEPRSAGAGGRGNCIIAAHRNMWEATFADLPEVAPGDEIVLTTPHGIFTDRVTASHETTVNNRQPLAQTKDAVLTLYTCVIPFKESHRWVVQARLVGAWVDK